MADHAGRYLQHLQPSILRRAWNSIFPAMPFSDYGIFGFDISKWQDVDATPQGVDFAKMRNYGAAFVIIKTGQGAAADPDFARNWADAKAAGLPRASYWFYDPRYPPQSQAAKWWSLVRYDLPEGSLWLDLEHPASWGGSFGTWQSWKVMLDEIKRLSGLRVGIYTGYYYWKDKTIGADLNYFKQYPLWLAWYTSSPAYVSVPAPWNEVLIWQTGTPAIGIEAGAESLEIDYNKFNGTQEQFILEFGGLPLPPPPPPTGEIMEYTCTVIQQQKGYQDHNTTSLQRGLVNVGATFKGIQVWGNWVQHADGRWFDTYKQGALAIRVVEVVVPPPPPPPAKILTNIINVFNDGSIDVNPQ